MSVSEQTKQKALKALDGLEQITRNEMLVRGIYFDTEVDEEKRRKGTLCRGHRACLIGSLWLGYGIKPEGRGYEADLPGTGSDQVDFVARRPGLKLAWTALNQAAERRFKRAGTRPSWLYASAAEALFERGVNGDERVGAPPDRRGVLRLVASARKIVEAS